MSQPLNNDFNDLFGTPNLVWLWLWLWRPLAALLAGALQSRPVLSTGVCYGS